MNLDLDTEVSRLIAQAAAVATATPNDRAAAGSLANDVERVAQLGAPAEVLMAAVSHAVSLFLTLARDKKLTVTEAAESYLEVSDISRMDAEMEGEA